MELSKEEKRMLLNAARKSIESIFTGEEPPKCDYSKYPSLKKESGAFVTLTENGMLRGCIGYITSDKPLYETVCEAAIHAAQNDPRFEPVRRTELPLIHIEVSVLSEPFPIDNYDDIVLGKHGLIVEEKGRRGLLLPQVPVEYNMNKEQYLEALCQKAGLPSDYWKVKQLNLYAFTADVFSEDELEEK
ncbi:AMMECR1 domain protein [Melioribacter roseus P3M-2]|uniref:AMMECR1 domain protein n=1 Tax=Melioribacter roseus (strain DSM 23840 / JCM 17771 / VKM B-2668 / P3M-2) TaxID=1191523 RepID=I6ZPJ0_MELRP|nr:AmmeMemoRadiSam system protein A [Melioribacter roseus]AFN73939.1 AMMECR1 domain protein [Melioribacter roseus P3M-2]